MNLDMATRERFLDDEVARAIVLEGVLRVKDVNPTFRVAETATETCYFF